MRKSALALAAFTAAAAIFAGGTMHNAEAEVVGSVCVTVGSTCDACDGAKSVWFYGKTGRIDVAANGDRTVDLACYQKTLKWYCGGSVESCSNSTYFNRVRCKRACNGAITWTFYNKP